MTATLPMTRIVYAAAAALLLTAAIIAAADGMWWIVVVGVVAPDLPLFAGGGRELARGQLHPRAVPAYNAAHRVAGPLVLFAAGVFAPAALVAGLAWGAHIAVDRAVGYGLRDAAGFQRA